MIFMILHIFDLSMFKNFFKYNMSKCYLITQWQHKSLWKLYYWHFGFLVWHSNSNYKYSINDQIHFIDNEVVSPSLCNIWKFCCHVSCKCCVVNCCVVKVFCAVLSCADLNRTYNHSPTTHQSNHNHNRKFIKIDLIKITIWNQNQSH